MYNLRNKNLCILPIALYTALWYNIYSERDGETGTSPDLKGRVFMAKNIDKFVGITINGEDFSNAEVIYKYALDWHNQAVDVDDQDLLWITSSLRLMARLRLAKG